MSTAQNETQMTIESLQAKLLKIQTLNKQLTEENEELYHQYNHLMIRNGKMLKRVDDLQKIIDDLHIRIEELQLINSNMMHLNDNLRRRTDKSINDVKSGSSDRHNGINDVKYFAAMANIQDPADSFDLEDLFERWKNYPGQKAQNAPNLRKQVLMLLHVYNNKSLRATELFNLTGVGGVTGARYVSTLKKFGLIRYTGARKKGHYEITPQGIQFVESPKSIPAPQSTDEKIAPVDSGRVDFPKGIQLNAGATMVTQSVLEQDDL